jgi:hypothetical protein
MDPREAIESRDQWSHENFMYFNKNSVILNDTPLGIDIVKLYGLLADSEKQKKIGSRIIKSILINILRSKLGLPQHEGRNETLYETQPEGAIWLRIGPPSWLRRTPGIAARTAEEHEVPESVDVSKLSEEEKKIARELGIIK